MDDVSLGVNTSSTAHKHKHNPVLIHAEGGGIARALWEWMTMGRTRLKSSRTSW